MVGKLRAWWNRRWYLWTKQWTRAEFDKSESWAKNKWPIVDWDHIQEIRVSIPQGITVDWDFADWQTMFPGCKGVMYLMEKNAKHLFNPREKRWNRKN